MEPVEIVMEASSDRFIRTVQDHWEAHGEAAMSARRISVSAGAPVSSIYHHFGSLEHLFVAAQQASLGQAQQWRDDWLAQCSGLPADPEAFAAFFAESVDQWANGQRRLAFAWRECQLLGEGSALLRPLSAQWDQLWSEFWDEASARFALGAGTRIAHRLFENESFLHMIRWRRLVDRAALDETARVLAAWLSGGPVPATPWRDFARAEALRAMPALPARDEAATRIVAAAADLIADTGVASLTHRAVADRAGMTLGSVSHKFGTKSALVEAAFEGLYAANLQRLNGGSATPPAPDRERLLAAIGDMIQRARSRGSDELFVAVARDPALSQFGLQLRYLRGRTSLGTMKALLGPGHAVTPTEAALFSSFTTSQIRCYAGTDPATAQDAVRGEIDALLALLGAR